MGFCEFQVIFAYIFKTSLTKVHLRWNTQLKPTNYPLFVSFISVLQFSGVFNHIWLHCPTRCLFFPLTGFIQPTPFLANSGVLKLDRPELCFYLPLWLLLWLWLIQVWLFLPHLQSTCMLFMAKHTPAHPPAHPPAHLNRPQTATPVPFDPWPLRHLTANCQTNNFLNSRAAHVIKNTPTWVRSSRGW